MDVEDPTEPEKQSSSEITRRLKNLVNDITGDDETNNAKNNDETRDEDQSGYEHNLAEKAECLNTPVDEFENLKTMQLFRQLISIDSKNNIKRIGNIAHEALQVLDKKKLKGPLQMKGK